MWYTMENYFTMKRNEVLIHAATWMKLESTTLSERSQSQKTVYYDSIFMKCPEELNPQREKVGEKKSKQISGYLDWGLTAKEYDVSLWSDVSVFELIVVK